jgi:thiosulfate dehydrogenase
MRHAKILGGSAAVAAVAALALGWSSSASSEDTLTRTVWACDQRKQVVVEGVAPDAKLDPQRAQLVADILSDLMRYCEEEITAEVGLNQQITIRANGQVVERWTPGAPIGTLQVSFGEPTDREKAIWQAELDKMVKEGDRLFHSDEIGKNGVACAMCHPNASNTHPETYPKFQTQIKKVVQLRDMVNWCIQNPLEGTPLAADDPKMQALESYILASRKGVALEIGKH